MTKTASKLLTPALSTVTVAAPTTPSRPSIHCLVYGDAGSKKSTFAATFPTPMLVFCFDPLGKDMPYLRRGRVLPLVDADIPWRHVVGQDEHDVLVRLEYYHNADPQKPTAWRRFMERLATNTPDYTQFDTLVFDSVTFMALAKRHEAQYKLLPHAKDPRQWYAAATAALEEVLMVRLSGMPQNVVVIAHVNEEKDEVHGNLVVNPAAPGKLSKGLPAGFGEFYRAYVQTKDGVNRYRLQTEKDARYNAASQIWAPNPCVPRYDKLWKRWDESQHG